MRYQLITFSEENRVAAIKILPVDSRDQISRLSEEISECCQTVRMSDGISVLVITEGSPGLFAIEEQIGLIGKDLPGYISISQSIGECEKPVIIGIEGNAVDLGLEMALSCDIRVASETSRFGFSQVKAGLMPCDGGTQRLSRTVGKAKALEMILTGELIDAQEAHRIGLVSRIVSGDQVTPIVMKLAKNMASKSPISLQYCKEAVVKGMDLTLEEGLRLEADLYFLMHTTHDRKEGIKAFQEKREPHFKGT